MVATDVVDEGVDIPSCTLILRYDLPMDFRGYIQSKGRARHKAGQYVMLLSKTDDNFMAKHANYRRVESFLKQVGADYFGGLHSLHFSAACCLPRPS